MHRAGEIVISALIVRNKIFYLHFSTNEHTDKREITLVGEGVTKINPHVMERQSIGHTRKGKQKIKDPEPFTYKLLTPVQQYAMLYAAYTIQTRTVFTHNGRYLCATNDDVFYLQYKAYDARYLHN